MLIKRLECVESLVLLHYLRPPDHPCPRYPVSIVDVFAESGCNFLMRALLC